MQPHPTANSNPDGLFGIWGTAVFLTKPWHQSPPSERAARGINEICPAGELPVRDVEHQAGGKNYTETQLQSIPEKFIAFQTAKDSQSATKGSDLLFKEDKALVPPKSERVAELPEPPGGGTSITRYVPHV